MKRIEAMTAAKRDGGDDRHLSGGRVRHGFALVVALFAGTSLCAPSLAQGPQSESPVPQDVLEQEFKEPPSSARPHVWWHWMNGNVTKEGITKDIEWFHRIGIGGFQIFDINLATPQVVRDRLPYMHLEWKDAFRLAVDTANRRGLDVTIAASPGWSETGGPWVPAADGVKKFVWSEVTIPGGVRYKAVLPPVPRVSGPFQNIPENDPLADIAGNEAGHALPEASGSVAVLAYPVVGAPITSVPRFVGTDGAVADGSTLLDADLNSGLVLAPGTVDKPPVLTYKFDKPQTVRSATFYAPGSKALFTGATVAPQLEASTDGASWKAVAEIPAAEVPTTVSFPPVTASAFRIALVPQEMTTPNLGKPAPGADMSLAEMSLGTTVQPLRVTEFRLLGDARITQFERKAAFAYVPEYYPLDSADPATAGAEVARVVDLTSAVKPDGHIDWTPPKGSYWRILRMGWSLVGSTNHPAPAEATGLEVDKFDGEAVERYLNHYIGMYRDTVGDERIGKAGISAIQTDSIEVGALNWTPRILDHFRRLRGYDPRPYLPALAGGLIGTRAQSDRFLYDFRRTLADLMSSQHYETVARVGRKHGLKVYGEALENGRPQIGDDMTMRSFNDVPMAAMWTYARGDEANPSFIADIRGAASVAHIYGRDYVAAESLTSALNPWAHSPSDLRRVIDLEFVHGVNRPFIHSVVHQPVDDKQPGLSLSVFGQMFNRHAAWADMARPWIDYMARTSYLLQQGRNIADVAYFHGEEAPLTGLFKNRLVQDAPTRYGYDFINPDALFEQVSVRGDRLVSKGGAEYRALYLGGSSEKLTVATLERLRNLVREGMILVGNAPRANPSLSGDDAVWRRLVGEIWPGAAEVRLGAGRVISGTRIEPALAALGLAPDFEYRAAGANNEILFAHRRKGDADFYFLTNRRNAPATAVARFRVSGRVPEIWRADTGTTVRVSYRTVDGVTEVDLKFAPEDSYFVVFRKAGAAPGATVPAVSVKEVGRLEGPWSLAFSAPYGGPAARQVAKLLPLDQSDEAEVRYFSGTSSYSTRFDLPRGHRAGSPLFLDLGEVGDVAEVLVNGNSAGIAWRRPYRLDIGRVVKAGTNSLEIRVANLWVNRLIGDQQPGAVRKTFTAIPTYQADAPLRPAGLIGPVRLLSEK